MLDVRMQQYSQAMVFPNNRRSRHGPPAVTVLVGYSIDVLLGPLASHLGPKLNFVAFHVGQEDHMARP